MLLGKLQLLFEDIGNMVDVLLLPSESNTFGTEYLGLVEELFAELYDGSSNDVEFLFIKLNVDDF